MYLEVTGEFLVTSLLIHVCVLVCVSVRRQEMALIFSYFSPHPYRMCINGHLDQQQLGLDALPDLLSGQFSINPSVITDVRDSLFCNHPPVLFCAYRSAINNIPVYAWYLMMLYMLVTTRLRKLRSH